MFKKATVFVTAALCLMACGATVLAKDKKPAAKADREEPLMPDTELIDVPTAGMLDYYGLQVRNRFFSGGGVLGGVAFGVLPRLNLGATMALEQLIGTDTSVRMVRPEIQAKYRFYDGTKYLPALVLGYDGQGYYYNHNDKKYMEKGRALYLAGSQEVLLPGLQVHPGMNISDFDSQSIFFFTGLNYTVEDSFSLMLEWDNIQRFNESRVNTGVRFYVTSFFQIDFAIREIGKNETFSDGQPHRPERIVQLKYNTSF